MLVVGRSFVGNVSEIHRPTLALCKIVLNFQLSDHCLMLQAVPRLVFLEFTAQPALYKTPVGVAHPSGWIQSDLLVRILCAPLTFKRGIACISDS